MVHVDLDAWIDKMRKCEHLEEDELKTLCEMVRKKRERKGRGGGRGGGGGGVDHHHHHPAPLCRSSLFFVHHRLRSRRSWSRSPTSSPSTARSR
jgi:hypothetical protein